MIDIYNIYIFTLYNYFLKNAIKTLFSCSIRCGLYETRIIISGIKFNDKSLVRHAMI